ncbi:MAG: hypothetical protein QGH85_00950 [Candidatus Pacebacteria bacterium]|jgi:hypothetical protein|nr:hypothetical protein [Parcubacteria group bacterium]MDP6249451.1 hypothetical protein [Candidatus Paceibacterota bacterium]MDP7159567.1 hypothetical protein [Candidatus Paceibacterota bacterium]MDP7366286.1 hypothetical protein [Candidatus Paceibacterota bacterium]MDP7466175.1 hypothetical protein [Candidatus Paceibacterota bacterium]|tara:strand:- start:125 stop:583 length:459 start_codon:yes stop_codon:yes gene_type:complete
MNDELKIKKKKGFALLYSVLIASVLLAIGLAIFNITIKELLLSSLGRDSQFAFYAADTGAECALYWDFVGGAFASSSPSSIECAGTIIDGMGGKPYGVPSTFTLDFSPEPYCVTVSVTKYDAPTRTIVESRGYNTCDTTNPRRVERAIRATY